jgi:hypothetical protein
MSYRPPRASWHISPRLGIISGVWRKSMKHSKRIVVAIVVLLFPFMALASDKSDATDLMNKTEKSSKVLEVSVKNFGDKDDLAAFDKALATIRQGKVKLAQSKFLDAKALFEQYQKAEFDLYGSLAAKYIQRTQEMIDKIAEELGDYVNQPDVLKGFSDASENLNNAKTNIVTKQYLSVITSCRLAKKYVLGCYGIVKKEIPADYKRDVADNNGQIFQ